jgi:hypothetical protein
MGGSKARVPMRGTISDTRRWHRRTPFGDFQLKRRKSAGSTPDATTHRKGVMVMEREITRKREKVIGTDLVLSGSDESAGSLPGGSRLKGKSRSRGRHAPPRRWDSHALLFAVLSVWVPWVISTFLSFSVAALLAELQLDTRPNSSKVRRRRA